jgi:uncharacterized protein YdeI (YjbR/CyaY-like superfamily)
MQKRFQAVLETFNGAPTPLYARLPFDPHSVWTKLPASRTGLRVRGSIRACSTQAARKTAASTAECSFDTSLIPRRDGSYLLMVTRKMQSAADVNAGSLADIVLEANLETQVTLPPELVRLFKEDRSVKRWFETLNYSNRRYIAQNVAEPKSAEARVRRAESWVERMMLTMEGEEVPPPILQMAFRRQPLAREGWERLTPIQRRNGLLSIFSCQSAEARDKRVEWYIEAALKKAGVQPRTRSAKITEYDW